MGAVEPEAQRLLDVTAESLEAGLAECREGRRLGDISHAVQEVVEAAGFSVVRSLVGPRRRQGDARRPADPQLW